MNILVIAAHPDDEVLGCGGTIHKHLRQKDKIMTLIFSKGRKDKMDQRFDLYSLKGFIDEIEKKIAIVQPNIIYTHHLRDMNRDHAIVAEATLIATRALPIEIYGYEVFSTSGSFEFNPDTYQKLLYVDLQHKLETMTKKYSEELRFDPHPRSLKGIQVAAEYRGMQINTNYAEAFITMRRIIV